MCEPEKTTPLVDEPPEPLRNRGTRAVQRMVELAPATGGLALWIRHQDLADPSGTRLIASDGATIYYGDGFEALSLPEQIGLVAHEVLHVALRHSQRFADLQRRIGDVDLELYNVCADAIVNSTLSHLSWLQLPTTAVQLEQLLTQALHIHTNADACLAEWDLERLYRAIDDRRAPSAPQLSRSARKRRAQGDSAEGRSPREAKDDGSHQLREQQSTSPRSDGPRASRARQLANQIARDLLPSDTRGEPLKEAELARDWGERLLRAHASDGAYSMLRALIADLPRTRTPWEQVLRSRLTRGLSRRGELSWSRPSRSYLANRGRLGADKRMPWEPGRTASKAVPRLAVIVDVSGSIEDPLLARFAREIDAITRRLETAITIVIGDHRVSHVDTCAPGRSKLERVEFRGGGGTDFAPLFEEADRHRPDIGVVLTDLQGPARFRPTWAVLWAVPATCDPVTPPFGTKLLLD